MEGVSAKPVAQGDFKVAMDGLDVMAALSPHLLSVSYTDFEEGEADTLDVRLDNADGRFFDAWYPAKGQTLALGYGYKGKALINAGLFEIDQIDLEGPPDVVVLRGIASGVMAAHRTPQSRAYDNTTLAAIAQQVARRKKLKLVGKIEPIQIARVTQINEGDLAFMRRLAEEYGYAFSVKGEQMIFYRRAELRAALPILTIDRTDIVGPYHVRDKIMGIVETSQVSYHDARTKRLNRYQVRSTDRATGGDAVKLNLRAESDTQAKAKAGAALDAANENATQLELTMYGNPALIAGINFTLTGMGKLGGIYHVVRSRHDIDRDGGYRTEIEAKRVRLKDKRNG